jgi:hypothetical protein
VTPFMTEHICCTHGHEPATCCQTGHIEMLIERGSLGTPEAKAARATVTDEEVQRILALAKKLREANPT